MSGHYSRYLKAILDEYTKIKQVARVCRASPGYQQRVQEKEVFEMMALSLDDQKTLAATAEWISEHPTMAKLGHQMADQVRQVSAETQEKINEEGEGERADDQADDRRVEPCQAPLPALQTVAVPDFNTPLETGQDWW